MATAFSRSFLPPAKMCPWRYAYLNAAPSFLRSLSEGDRFTGEDLNNYVRERIGEPSDFGLHQNELSYMSKLVLERWTQRDQIEQRGKARMKNKRAHGRSTDLYVRRRPSFGTILRGLFD